MLGVEAHSPHDQNDPRCCWSRCRHRHRARAAAWCGTGAGSARFPAAQPPGSGRPRGSWECFPALPAYSLEWPPSPVSVAPRFAAFHGRTTSPPHPAALERFTWDARCGDAASSLRRLSAAGRVRNHRPSKSGMISDDPFKSSKRSQEISVQDRNSKGDAT
jgi:hypothetical protein